MITVEDDVEFEPSPGKTARGGGSRLAQVRAAVAISGRIGRRSPAAKVRQTGLRAHFRKTSESTHGKSVVASSAASRRQVVVKARYIVHAAGGAAPLRMHVAYLAREKKEERSVEKEPEQEKSELGKSVDYLSREGQAGRGDFLFYNQREVGIDAQSQTTGWQADSRHFRLIVSAEDGEALGDLKPFIREVMGRLEGRLGTRLEWLAVDHHDTDNPHTHILIRGRRADGQELFIPSKLISAGIREHAQEVVFRVLGPRPAVEIDRALEVEAIRYTSIDDELTIVQRRLGVATPVRPDHVARLEQLERWDLAERTTDGWRVAEQLRDRLNEMEERAEVEAKVDHLRRGPRKPLLGADGNDPVTGELVRADLGHDFGDSFLAVIETGAGELRYAKFDRADDLAVLDDAPLGAIVVFEPKVARPRASDEAIDRIAAQTDGLYSRDKHTALDPRVDQGLVDGNVRRLEAMRRAGYVVRRSDGAFEIGKDHLARATSFEHELIRKRPVSARVASYWSLSQQVSAFGPTYLDRALTGELAQPPENADFGRRFAAALQQRRLFLIEQGWLGGIDQKLKPSILKELATGERAVLARQLAGEIGLPVLLETTARIRGVYARRVDLAQGRVALIVGDRQAHIVPWRPVLERFAGREVEGVMRGQTLSWGVARGIGPSLPSMG